MRLWASDCGREMSSFSLSLPARHRLCMPTPPVIHVCITPASAVQHTAESRAVSRTRTISILDALSSTSGQRFCWHTVASNGKNGHTTFLERHVHRWQRHHAMKATAYASRLRVCAGCPARRILRTVIRSTEPHLQSSSI